ncbi:MAG: hypothetical protein HC836_50375 [Richelia sp. RM2_1_2]|nr:hypothetical protein [Richelia sp. RM2_1_2]
MNSIYNEMSVLMSVGEASSKALVVKDISRVPIEMSVGSKPIDVKFGTDQQKIFVTIPSVNKVDEETALQIAANYY